LYFRLQKHVHYTKIQSSKNYEIQRCNALVIEFGSIFETPKCDIRSLVEVIVSYDCELQIAAVMVCLFVGSWLPYALVAQLGIMGFTRYVTPLTAELPIMLAKASYVWNPIVYALSHPRFRAALADQLPGVLSTRLPQPDICLQSVLLRRSNCICSCDHDIVL